MNDEIVKRDALPLGLAPRTEEDDRGAQVPLVTIAQPQNTERPDGVPDGVWFVPLTGESLGDKIRLIPIAQFFTRAYWDKEDLDAEEPICASDDGLHPISGKSPVVGGTAVEICAACPLQKWTTDPKDRKVRNPPVCSRSINYFGVVLGADGSQRIARIGFKRTSYKAGSDIEAVTRAAMPPRPLWGTVFELSLSKVEQPKRKYFVAKQRVVGLTSQQHAEAFAECEALFKQWQGMKARVAAESMSDGAAAPDASDDEAPF